MRRTTQSCSVEIPIVLVKEYAYCPRMAFYKYFTMWEVPTKSMTYPSYTKLYLVSLLRGHGVKGDVQMECLVRAKSLGIHGKVDAVVVNEGRVYVIEVKLCTSKAKLKEKAFHHLVQVIAYAIACEETFKKPVEKAMIVVLSTERVIELGIKPRFRKLVIDMINEFRRYIEEERLPPRTSRKTKCYNCFYSKFCPK